ncbi:hypothetical protein PG997_008179 [Apiospora hydei]|uniref:Alpha/beta hydrolase fold-3 domain-containing protein n=1 Tax=Apiospora hydei TaxID=1337664 RepID=A0ABR1WCX2_9PEZI
MALPTYLLLALSISRLSLGQATLPAQTQKLPESAQVAAIVPTSLGQVGISPVDIPPPENYQAPIGADSKYLAEEVCDGKTTTSWIHRDSDFGTATITTTDKHGKPEPTAIPEGFRVAIMGGKLELTLSQWLKGILDGIAHQAPACPRKTRRGWDYRRHQYLEGRATPDMACVRTRTNKIYAAFRQVPAVMAQFSHLNDQIARATGNDAATMALAGQMETFVDGRIAFEVMDTYEEVDVAVIPKASEILASVGTRVLGVASALAFFYGAQDNTLTRPWKLRSDPEPMPIFPSCPVINPGKPERCPDPKPACAGERCKGGPDGRCTNEFRDCNCIASSKAIPHTFYDGWQALEDMISDFDLALHKRLPEANCDIGKDGRNQADVDSEAWSKYGFAPLPSFIFLKPHTVIDNLCTDVTFLSEGFIVSKKASDIGLDSYQGWNFELGWSSDGGGHKGCSRLHCADVFGKFKDCSYNDYTQFKTGKLKLDCGTANYASRRWPNHPKSQLVTVQRETDLSLLYRVLRTVIKPLRPRLVKPGKPEPAGSPRLANHPRRKNGCKIVERCHDRTDTWLYDFVPETSSSFVRKQGPGPLHNVYYFAGGGFQSPPSGQHWSFVGKIASSLAGTHRFTIVSYPLAPNSPASESLPVLRQLLTRLVSESATAGKKVVLMGDSAGANVALSLAFWWATHLSKTIDAYSRKTSFGLGPIETGKPLDLEADMTRLRSVLESVVVISPASDLRNSNSQMAALDQHDPLLGSEYTGAVAEAWTASPPGELDTGISADDPRCLLP